MTLAMPYPLLDALHNPEQLRALPERQLAMLADELRRFLIDSVGRTGGHLAANLGVVELTVALHYVYKTPEDRLVWDVGHQSYPHKILTGRREQMSTLRQKEGLAGFPKRSESPYDAFGVGHSSTSVSAALGMAIPGTLFEELGFNYIGPVDGHDLPTLVKTLRNLRGLKGPQFLHVVTKKGKGFKPAEDNPCTYHGVSAFDPLTGTLRAGKAGTPTYTEVFGDWICDMADQDPRLIAITPAMREGSGLVAYSERFPDRYFDVGIAEQHAVTLAAGLACEGAKPVVAIYSTFLQRAYDQLIHDVAIQNLPVLFAIDRAGVVGPDGPTHAGSFDLSYLRCVPNMVVMAPADENECRQMLYTGFQLNQPAAVRYPRGGGLGVPVQKTMTALPVGKADVLRTGRRVAILAFGSMVQPARQAGDGQDATVVNMRFVKPLDEVLIARMAETHELVVTVEENAVMGGAGSAVGEYLAACGSTAALIQLGLPDVFHNHGSRPELLKEAGLTVDGIAARIKAHFSRQACHGLSAQI